MNLRGIVAVAGKPGLWRALAQNKSGFILESLDANKTKIVANLSTAKIAALDEITIFGNEEDLKLTDVFERMKAVNSIPDAKADTKVLRQLFREIAPDHDEEKVYASDMKKIVNWFNVLKEMPLFDEPEPSAEPTTEPVKEEVKEEPVAEAKETKPAAKKAKTTDSEKPAPKAKAAKK